MAYEDWKLKPARDLGLPLSKRVRSLHREIGLPETLAHYAWRALVRAYLALYHRLEVRGRKHLPAAPPFVLASNHSSHLDALVLALCLPRRLQDHIFPIAASDTFFETPMLAAFAAFVVNALPMWRRRMGAHALEDLRQRLTEEPCAYILFPEGTRSRDGRMAPFKHGLGMLVAGTSALVVPCHIEGAFAALPPDRRWPRCRKLVLRIGEPLSFSGTANDRAGWQEVAERTEAAVRGLPPTSPAPGTPGALPGWLRNTSNPADCKE